MGGTWEGAGEGVLDWLGDGAEVGGDDGELEVGGMFAAEGEGGVVADGGDDQIVAVDTLSCENKGYVRTGTKIPGHVSLGAGVPYVYMPRGRGRQSPPPTVRPSTNLEIYVTHLSSNETPK